MNNSLTWIIRRACAASAFSLMLFVIVGAQEKQKPDAPQKPANTLDAWKQALPENEQVNSSAEYSPASRAENEKALEEIKKGLMAMEQKWMEALKLRDEPALRHIVGDDFTINSARVSGALVGKTQYLEQSLADLKLSSYNFDKLEVRVYGRTAVVNGWLTQQATLANAEWSGNFLFTDVWVYRNGSWKVVSRHLSASPKT